MTDLIRYSLENRDELIRVFSAKTVEKARLSALRKTTLKARTMVSRLVRKEYNVKAGDIGKVVQVKQHKSGSTLLYTGKRLELNKFSPGSKRVQSARGPRRAATVNVKKSTGRKVVGKPKGFDGAGFYEAGKVMARKTKARSSARKLYGLAIAQMVANTQVLDAVNEFIGEEFQRQFNVAMNFFGNVKKRV